MGTPRWEESERSNWVCWRERPKKENQEFYRSIYQEINRGRGRRRKTSLSDSKGRRSDSGKGATATTGRRAKARGFKKSIQERKNKYNNQCAVVIWKEEVKSRIFG